MIIARPPQSVLRSRRWANIPYNHHLVRLFLVELEILRHAGTDRRFHELLEGVQFVAEEVGVFEELPHIFLGGSVHKQTESFGIHIILIKNVNCTPFFHQFDQPSANEGRSGPTQAHHLQPPKRWIHLRESLSERQGGSQRGQHDMEVSLRVKGQRAQQRLHKVKQRLIKGWPLQSRCIKLNLDPSNSTTSVRHTMLVSK